MGSTRFVSSDEHFLTDMSNRAEHQKRNQTAIEKRWVIISPAPPPLKVAKIPPYFLIFMVFCVNFVYKLNNFILMWRSSWIPDYFFDFDIISLWYFCKNSTLFLVFHGMLSQFSVHRAPWSKWGCYFDINLHIFHSTITWLGVAPIFQSFFAFRPAGCLALRTETRKKTLKK